MVRTSEKMHFVEMSSLGDGVIWIYQGMTVIAVLQNDRIVRVRNNTSDGVDWITVKKGAEIDMSKRTWRQSALDAIAEIRAQNGA